PSITPVQQVELVNMLNDTQLAKFGENVSGGNRLSLGEKWEGMALAPVLDDTAPQDFFLMVGNDNDFLSSTCSVGGQNCSQGVDSDSTVLVYRVTLPTYVDPEYLASMLETASKSIAVGQHAALSLVESTGDNILDHAQVKHRAGETDGFSAWFSGSYQDTSY